MARREHLTFCENAPAGESSNLPIGGQDLTKRVIPDAPGTRDDGFRLADRTNLVVVGAEAKEARVPDVSERENWDFSAERHEPVIPV